MIIYQSSKRGFLDDVLSNTIEMIILSTYSLKTGKKVSESELRSWAQSMRYVGALLNDQEIPDDTGIAIEYLIPQTSKRIDVVLTGANDEGENAVLIELKQWSSAEKTEKDGIVAVRFQGGRAETSHPAYQAWSYAALLEGFNETVYEEKIQLKPCAYLHNYEPDNVISDGFYASYIEKAPIFLKGAEEQEKLRVFIKKFIKYGDKKQTMLRIENGKIKPSKSLADSIAKMLKGNEEFIMIDDQKVVYETAMSLAKQSSVNNKNVLIVEGGPGTGKSVVAVNLLVALTKKGLIAQYVTKNAAPRAVYESKLTGTLRKTEISNFFTGSGSFIDVPSNSFDALIVDEAHRLNKKSGMYKHLGENQVKEIIEAAKFPIFFIDEDQKVTWSDIGEVEEIKKWALASGATVHSASLSSQFRCNGSDGYLSWLDNTLQIKETANEKLDTKEYDFRIIDSASEFRELIHQRNKQNNKARMVAGYCWDWASKKDSDAYDIIIDGFKARWNLATDGSLWILAPESVKEVGCIHTCQGLEVDYIGVIVGSDLCIKDGKLVSDPSARSSNDKSLNGYKKLRKVDAASADKRADAIIRNTYRALMTRGMKGCYVYFVDVETKKYFESKLLI